MLEAKRIGYQVKGFDPKLWNDNGYEICYQGIKAKFDQNADLYKMLKTTSPKLLVESSTDKTWGTGVSLRDSCTLNQDKWHSTGWLSSMLMNIREDSKG